RRVETGTKESFSMTFLPCARLISVAGGRLFGPTAEYVGKVTTDTGLFSVRSARVNVEPYRPHPYGKLCSPIVSVIDHAELDRNVGHRSRVARHAGDRARGSGCQLRDLVDVAQPRLADARDEAARVRVLAQHVAADRCARAA